MCLAGSRQSGRELKRCEDESLHLCLRCPVIFNGMRQWRDIFCGQLRVRERERAGESTFHCSAEKPERKVTNISVQLGAGGRRLLSCEASHQNANDVITYLLSSKK